MNTVQDKIQPFIYFDNADNHADWKEKLGYFFLHPLNSTQTYIKVTLNPAIHCEQVVKKTLRVVLEIFYAIIIALGVSRIGKACLHFSNSYQSQYAIFNKTILGKSGTTNFYNTANQWEFLDGVLNEYEQAIRSDDEAWTGKKGSQFLHSELLRLQSDMTVLVIRNQSLKKFYCSKLEKTDIEIEDIKQINSLIENNNKISSRYKELLEILEPRLPKTNEPRPVIGLSNDGNTCYINSALQPLLAVKNFRDLVPDEIHQNEDEDNDTFEKRQAILNSFKELITSWNDKRSPSELGQLVGNLRITFFYAGLQQGGFDNFANLYSFQDAGSFFELILYVIGQQFHLKNVRTFTLPDGSAKKMSETTPQGVLLLKEKNGSVQNKIDAYGIELCEELNPEDAYVDEDPISKQKFALTKFTETNKIEGEPKEILVLRVENHVVNLVDDREINCSCLFDALPIEQEARYELVGFAQNHNQVHWTSVIYNGDAWFYCNDDRVEPIDPTDGRFKRPANYLVYKRKQ